MRVIPSARYLARRAALGLIAGSLPALIPRRSAAQDDPMATVSVRYAALGSYADRGVLETTYQAPGTSATHARHRFETRFRSPRNFFFRFDEDPDEGADAFVIWCDGGPFQSWWKTTGVHEVHDNGRGADAFFNGDYPTLGSANLVAPRFFPSALLYGPTTQLVEPRDAGEDQLDGRPCTKIVADRRITGVQTEEARPVAVWVDVGSGLVVQVQIDAEAGATGWVDRRLYRVEAQADPALGDDAFTFTPPPTP